MRVEDVRTGRSKMIDFKRLGQKARQTSFGCETEIMREYGQ